MWSHLSRQKGGGIGLRGPGETQLEVDRRLVSGRIRDLKAKLTIIQSRKEREVSARYEEHTVCLVGYTNAGKSRLMKSLTHADIFVQDQLFSTLDTRTRQWHIKEWGKILLSDTVGFIRDLPHHLVASFKATLEEARQARLLLHIVDASSPHVEAHIQSVQSVLTELECDQKPSLLVLNKCDKIMDRERLNLLLAVHPKAVAISAATGEGFEALRQAVIASLTSDYIDALITARTSNGKLQAYLDAHATIIDKSYQEDQVMIRCSLPRYLLHHVSGEDVIIKET